VCGTLVRASLFEPPSVVVLGVFSCMWVGRCGRPNLNLLYLITKLVIDESQELAASGLSPGGLEPGRGYGRYLPLFGVEYHRTRQNLVQMPSLLRRSKQDATAETQRRASNLPIRDLCAEKRGRYKLQSGTGNPRATTYHRHSLKILLYLLSFPYHAL
jgi:hypothetical protein